MRIVYLDFDGVLHPADVWLEQGGRMRLGDTYPGHALRNVSMTLLHPKS
jgi:hypothetical protein